MTNAVTLDETAAAQDEGLRPIDGRSNQLRFEWLALKAAKDEIDRQMTAIRDELGATLVVEGSQGLTADGKVVVRLSNVTTQGLDNAALKKAEPELYMSLLTRFLKVTKSERISIK